MPEELDEKVVKLHFLALGTELNLPTQTQADFTGVNVEGLFRNGHLTLLSCEVQSSVSACTLDGYRRHIQSSADRSIVPVAHSATVLRHQPSFPLDVVFLNKNWCCRSVIC